MRMAANFSMVGLSSSIVYLVCWIRLEPQTDSRLEAGSTILIARARAAADSLLGGRSHRLYTPWDSSTMYFARVWVVASTPPALLALLRKWMDRGLPSSNFSVAKILISILRMAFLE